MYTTRDQQRSFNESREGSLFEDIYASPFRSDYSRVIHAPGFRRLQGKTQLFPSRESDFFRNRLTHSLEVADIAKTIASRINNRELANKGNSFLIDLDLIEVAGLAHDLGHPPFGHQGEAALDACMYLHGGFEGNAQTLRLLSRIEKKVHNGNYNLEGFDSKGRDKREGLNLTYRTLASILKYDHQIPYKRVKPKHEFPGLAKGYYSTEKGLVDRIKSYVTGGRPYDGNFKTIECQIMDIADDIAYSTYDLEDVFKSGFINPFDLLAARTDFYRAISDNLNKVWEKARKSGKTEGPRKEFTFEDIIRIVSDVFKDIFNIVDERITGYQQLTNEEAHAEEFAFLVSQITYKSAVLLSRNGYERSYFSSQLVHSAINSIEFHLNDEIPALSTVRLNDAMRERIEVLKQLAFQSQILSPKLKIAEFRGKEIVKKIFRTLSKGKGHELLPDDVREVYHRSHLSLKRRVICDYIACMTDKYAIEFYGRLTSENPETIFKPF